MTDEHQDRTESQADPGSDEATSWHFVLPQPVRAATLRLMDAADGVADWIEEGISRMWSHSTHDDADDVEVEEVREENAEEPPPPTG